MDSVLLDLNQKCEKLLGSLYQVASSSIPLIQVWLPLMLELSPGNKVVQVSPSSSPYSISKPELQGFRQISCDTQISLLSTSLIAKVLQRGSIEVAQDLCELTKDQLPTIEGRHILNQGDVDSGIWIPLYYSGIVRPVGVLEIFVNGTAASIVDVIGLVNEAMDSLGLKAPPDANAVSQQHTCSLKSNPRDISLINSICSDDHSSSSSLPSVEKPNRATPDPSSAILDLVTTRKTSSESIRNNKKCARAVEHWDGLGLRRDGSSDLSLQDDEWSDLCQKSVISERETEECVGSSFDLTEVPSSKKRRIRHVCREGQESTKQEGLKRTRSTFLLA